MLLSALVQISFAENKPSSIIITNIVRVFMHQPGEYSVLYQEGIELKSFAFYSVNFHQPFQGLNVGRGQNLNIKVKIIMDVKEDEPMWALAKTTGKGNWMNNTQDIEVSIHVHSQKDINGAGWMVQDGKTKKFGMTQVIE